MGGDGVGEERRGKKERMMVVRVVVRGRKGNVKGRVREGWGR